MITGIFRDGHPRLPLTLSTADGPLEVEFIVDTGFEGDLTLPVHLARHIGGSPEGFSDRMLADGSLFRCPYYVTLVMWEGRPRRAEVLVLGSRPLVGTLFLGEHLLQVEMTEGGEVTAEPL